MNAKLALWLALATVSGGTVFGQGTTKFITFNGPPSQPPGTSHTFHEYLEAGLRFTGADTNWNSFGRCGGGISFFPENGTAYLQGAFTDSLKFAFADGSVFALESVDLAEYSTVVSNAATVYFIGYRHDGTIVTNALTTDGIIDGTGPVQDFQTLQFSDQMRNLDRVEIPLWSYGWSLDDLVVSIPEPSFGSLVLASGLMFWIFRSAWEGGDRERKTRALVSAGNR